MKISDAKKLFIQEWGILSDNWGIPRAAAELHALLLISPHPLSAEEIMEAYQVSTGGVSKSVQTLQQWGLIRRITKLGSKKYYFEAEKDMWKVAQQIARERKRRELEPIQTLVSKLSKIEGPRQEVKEFNELIHSIEVIADISAKALDLLTRSGLTGFLKGFK